MDLGFRHHWTQILRASLAALSSVSIGSSATGCSVLKAIFLDRRADREQFSTPVLAPLAVGSASLSQDVNWLATVRGRIGYTWGPGLTYFTGGGAWADVDYTGSYASAVGVTSATLNASNTLSGWVIGGGYEHKFTQKWSARLEYLYYNLDSTTLSVAADQPVNNITTTWTVPELHLHVVRAGINYKF